MTEIIQLKDLEIAIARKKIKNMYLKVHPPKGEVLISAPDHVSIETIRGFVITKLPWIKKQQQKITSQRREIPRDYIDRESHYFWGERYLMKVIEGKKTNVQIQHKTLILEVPDNTSAIEKEKIMAQWYRQQLKQAIPKLISKWEKIMGVKINKFFVQQMKTKWGSCNVTASNIRLNTELAKKPKICLEYVVVHEMTHLLEPSHNHKFKALMDKFMPQWRSHQQTLNNLPIKSN